MKNITIPVPTNQSWENIHAGENLWRVNLHNPTVLFFWADICHQANSAVEQKNSLEQLTQLTQLRFQPGHSKKSICELACPQSFPFFISERFDLRDLYGPLCDVDTWRYEGKRLGMEQNSTNPPELNVLLQKISKHSPHLRHSKNDLKSRSD